MPTWISDKQICPIFNNAGTRPNLEDKQRLGTCQPLVWLREKVTAALSGKEQDTNYPPSSQNWRNYWSVFCRKASLLQRRRHLFSYLFFFAATLTCTFFPSPFSGGYFLVLKEKNKPFFDASFRLFRRRLFPAAPVSAACTPLWGSNVFEAMRVPSPLFVHRGSISGFLMCLCEREGTKKKQTQYKCKSASH